MRNRAICCLLIISLLKPYLLLSQDNEVKPSAAVLLFKGKDVPLNYREGITNSFHSELSKLGKFLLVNRENIKEIEDEYRFQMMGYVDETNEYYAEMGKAIGAQKIIVGNIELVGELFQIEAKIIDVEKITEDSVASQEYHGQPEGLVKVAKILVYKLCGKEIPKAIYKNDFLNDRQLNIPKFESYKPTPWYQKWWFWSIIGLVAISTAGSIAYIVLYNPPEESNSTNVSIGGDMEDSEINIGK